MRPELCTPGDGYAEAGKYLAIFCVVRAGRQQYRLVPNMEAG